MRAPEDALAYALARLPATYAACAAVFGEARRLAQDFAPARLLDAGAGPAGGSWAALEAWPSLSAATWLDASAPFLDLARRLAGDGPGPLRAAEARRLDLTAEGVFPKADLVLTSYALAEIPEAAQAPLVARLWDACEGVLALVEPGTPAGFARILAARTALIEAGAVLLAPCPHQAACPLATPDWCHFSVRLPRSRDHRLAKGAAVPFEDERFAYLLAARPGIQAASRAPRVLAPPRTGKPGIELKLCGPDGVQTRFVGKRDKAAYARARRLGWGDPFEG
ncbi:small ribosomal subunit Rsm22 family protein [Phenylobacterium zucineum]|uniref:small ribosomal subunit Rsm22 family protein n=1 Tax=Phenylobacterium zucineum TaxID=284016 RepID=UPI0022A9C125|nr:small ribosomal subunit Rsm22 family protein [Phenylobacterium zucineum]